MSAKFESYPYRITLNDPVPTSVMDFISYYQATGIYMTTASGTSATYTPYKIMHQKAIIDSELLFSLTKAGRNILGYIIDTKLSMFDENHPVVILDHNSVTEYLKHRGAKNQADYVNFRRGLKDLLANDVLSCPAVGQYPDPDAYILNSEKIKPC